MENKKLIVSTSPHLKSAVTTQNIMRDVLIALAPAAVASVVLYGLRALLIIAVSVICAVGSEMLFCLACRKEQTVSDLSAAVTGLILALTLPTTVTLWQTAVGAIFAIVVVKCMFGGLGCNFANPAATARVMLLVSFSASVAGGTLPVITDLVASATPLAEIKAGGSNLPTLLEMLLGLRGGAIGEGCAVATLIGFVYLVVRRVIKWQVPATYMLTVFALSFLKSGIEAGFAPGAELALYQALGGGALFAAVFMITDYVSTPLSTRGKVVFAFGCGLITCLIRFFGQYPEGASFAILLMNILSPYIEKWCAPRPFGAVSPKKGGA